MIYIITVVAALLFGLLLLAANKKLCKRCGTPEKSCDFCDKK